MTLQKNATILKWVANIADMLYPYYMAKRKEIKQSDINKNNLIISTKKPAIFDYVLLFLIAAPFIILVLYGNQDTKLNSSSNQGLTSSWQHASQAFSNETDIPKVAPSPDKILPTFPLGKSGNLP